MNHNFTNTRRRELYERVLAEKGANHQITKAIEELGELITELCKIESGQTSNIALATEMADVTIMMEQLRIILDINDLVGEEMGRKCVRLARKLERGEL